MVRGSPCVVRGALLLFLIVSTALSASTPAPTPDEAAEDIEGVKRQAGGGARESMLRYLLMAMSGGPSSRYSQPQLLNRGVRRLGSEFLGKRNSEAPGKTDWEQREICEGGRYCDDQEGVEPAEEDLKKEQLSFTGQYDDDGGASQEGDTHDDLFNAKSKKSLRGFNLRSPYRGHLNNIFSIYLPKKMGSEFLGKRMGSEFLGKRMGSEFLGKRVLGSEFLGKRAMGSEFLGKRALGSEFLGKRMMGSEFLGKGAMGSEFLGKRVMGSEFLGKRAMGSEFLGKRAMGSEFLGKRAMGSEFLGKRQIYPDLEQKRTVGSEFLG